MNKMIAPLLSCVLAAAAYAQPAPREGGPPDGPPPQGRERPEGPRERPEGGPRDRDGDRDMGPRDGLGREGRPDGMMRPSIGGRAADPFERMRGYLEVVNRYTELSRDATSAGVAAVVAANDILRPKGSEAAIAYFTKAMETAKNPAVKRAIQLQLVDLYKVAGQQEKALEQLSDLIQSAPAETSAH